MCTQRSIIPADLAPPTLDVVEFVVLVMIVNETIFWSSNVILELSLPNVDPDFNLTYFLALYR